MGRPNISYHNTGGNPLELVLEGTTIDFARANLQAAFRGRGVAFRTAGVDARTSQGNPLVALGDLLVRIQGGSTINLQDTDASAVLALTSGSGSVDVRVGAGPTSIASITHQGTGRGVLVTEELGATSGNLRLSVGEGSIVATAAGNALEIETSGSGSVTVRSAGGVTVTPGDGNGIRGAIKNVLNSQLLDIELTGGRIETAAGAGIYAEHRGRGGIMVSNAGAVTSDSAAMIVTHSGAGSVTVRSGGDLTVTRDLGTRRGGIVGAITNSANAQLLDIEITAGVINVVRAGISGEHSGTGGLRLANAGAITTTSVSSGAVGIYGRIMNAASTGDMDIIHSGGSIATGSAASHGIDGEHRGLGAVSISSGAGITTAGAGAHGIYGRASHADNAGMMELRITEGVIRAGIDQNGMVTGAGSGGAWALHSGEGAIVMNSRGMIRSAGTGLLAQAEKMENGERVIIEAPGGSVETRDDDAHGIHAEHRGTGLVSITSAADITTMGARTRGVFGHSVLGATNPMVVRVTGGRIQTVDSAVIARSDSSNSVRVESAGVITTTADAASGIFGRMTNPGGTGRIDVDHTGGSVGTSGEGAHGVYAEHRGTGIVSVSSAADVTTAGADSHGVHGYAALAANSNLLEIEVTGGMIRAGVAQDGTVTGSNSIGVFAVHGGTGAIELSSAAMIRAAGSGVLARAQNTASTGNMDLEVTGGSVQTLEDEADAVAAEHEGMGNVDVEVASTFSGAIGAMGANAAGVIGRALNTAGTGSVAVHVRGGAVSTQGDDSHGVYGTHDGMGAVTVSSAAGVTTAGLRAHGVFGQIFDAANSELLDIDVTGGGVQTEGDDAYGVYAEHGGTGNVDVEVASTFSGVIGAMGANAAGVTGRALGAASTGSVAVHVRGGRVSTQGDNSWGVHGIHDGMGAVSVSSAAGVTTAGMGAHGVLGQIVDPMNSELLDVRVTGGMIRAGIAEDGMVTGAGSIGAAALHSGMGNIVLRSAGEVQAAGFGLLARAPNVDSTGDIDLDVTGGSVQTREDDAGAVTAEHGGTGAVDIEVAETFSGVIDTMGARASGVVGRALNPDPDSTGSVQVHVRGGAITTRGGDAYGVHGAHTGMGAVTVSSAAGVTTEGMRAHGVFGEIINAANSELLDVAVAGGSVQTRGLAAHGVFASRLGVDGGIAVQVNAPVTAAGARSHGIFLNGGGGVDVGAPNTVTINSMVSGGEQTGRGLYLFNGGTVTVGQGGLLRADSGIAIQAARGSLMVNVQDGGQIGRDELDIQRIQGGGGEFDTTTIEVRDVVLLQDNVLTEETVGVMYGIRDGELALGEEAEAEDPLDCGARCWRWLLTLEAPASTRALALEVFPQALLHLTRPVRAGRQGDYETAETGHWLDISGHYGSFRPASASTHSGYEQQWVRAEGGFQGILPQFTRDGCKALLGLSAHFLDSSASDIRGVSASGAAAELDVTGAGFGLHVSWHDVHGFYARAEGRASWYEGRLSAEQMRPELGAAGWSLSLSGGRSLPLARWPGAVLTPHAQLSWTEVRVDEMDLPFAAFFDRSRSVRARLGLGVQREGRWREAVALLQAAGSVEYEFDGETVVVTEPEDVRLLARPERVWGVLSLGASLVGKGGGMLARLGAGEYELSARVEGAGASSGNYEAAVSANLRLRF